MRRAKRALSGVADLVLGLLLDAIDALGVENTFAEEKHLEVVDGVAEGLGLALAFGTVEAVVVRMGVRIGAGDMAVDESGTLAGAAVGDGGLEGMHARDGIGAIDFRDVEVREVGKQARNVAAGGVDFNRNGNGVAVVFNDDEEREFAIGGDADGFPEFAFAGGAFTDGDVDDFVAVEAGRVELAIVGGACGREARLLRDGRRSRAQLRHSRLPGGTGSRSMTTG